MKNFSKPLTGIIDVNVCSVSGLLPTNACNEGRVSLPFLEGTQPTQVCNLHGATNMPHFPGTRPAFDPDFDILIQGLPSINLQLPNFVPPSSSIIPDSNSQNRSYDELWYLGDDEVSDYDLDPELPSHNFFLD
jgi:hypothetical protein